MEHANLKELQSLDVDASDNLTEEMMQKFIQSYGLQLKGITKSDHNNCHLILSTCMYSGLSLAGMPHITDTLWNTVLPRLRNAHILILGSDARMSIKVHVDHLIDAIAKHCSQLRRLEFRWDNDTLR